MSGTDSQSRTSRRELLFGAAGVGAAGVALAALAGTGFPRAAQAQSVNELQLQTVAGLVAGSAIEKAVAHEHLFVDFMGPTDPAYMNVNWSDANGTSANRLMELKAQGVNLFVDWGCMGVGRNVLLLRDVGGRAGVNVVCPTGIYKELIPPAYIGMPIDKIAERFVEELTRGCDATMIRAGFIKCAVSDDGPTATETMIHRAAAMAAKTAGATIALHCPYYAAAERVIATLKGEGFEMTRFVWGHAQPSTVDQHKAVAAEGATIQYDAISAHSDPFFNGPIDDASMLDRLEAMAKAGFDKQVLVSADGSTYVNPQKWQYDRIATYVHGYFAPQLEARLGAEMANRILRDNVIHAFRKPDAAM
jgi:phosphotriesterase-related protein